MPRLTTRDFKKTHPRPLGAGRLMGFVLGMIVGAVLASFGFMLHRAHARHAPVPSAITARPARGAAVRGAATSAVVEPAAPAPTAVASAAPAAHAAQQYDFYSMLPRFTVTVPRPGERAGHPGAPQTAAAVDRAADHAASYLLQVGAYRSTTDAQAVRARLAHMGIEAKVQRAVRAGGVWYLVQIGPLAGPAQLDKVRQALRAARMNALAIRIG